MSESTTTQCLLPNLFGKKLVARFDVRHGSSDGGAVLLKAAEHRLGVVEALTDCFEDRREQGKIEHDALELFGQRIYGLACGYADCNDAARLGADPVHKALIDRDPVEGRDLGSQSTLSRFENAVGSRELLRMSMELLDRIVQRHKKRLGRKLQHATIDLDVTDDATYGSQQLALFNGFYGTHCYLPLLGFVSFNDESEQYLCAAMLRSGRASCAAGAIGMLRRIIRCLRRARPGIRILVRLDGGFASPKLFDFLEEQNVAYVVGFACNDVLRRAVEEPLQRVRRRAEQGRGAAREYGHRFYAAATWKHKRRIVYKAEVVHYDGRELRDNPRFVVTNLGRIPKRVYELYCQRGEIENRIKELQDGMQIGRTSCTRFWANQFRVLLTVAAYGLMQEMRLWARRTRLARAQVETLRLCLLKVSAHVEVSVRRIVLHMPRSFAYLDVWTQLASVAARAG